MSKNQRELLFLGAKLLILIQFLTVLGFVFFGIARCSDSSMHPALKSGDLALYYRLEKTIQTGDVVVLEKDHQVRRIAAVAGDTVDVTEEGLVINGYLQQETEIYEETLPFTEGITFPVTVQEGEVFVLGDNRPMAADSRLYGTVKIEEIEGQVITVLRRRGI